MKWHLWRRIFLFTLFFPKLWLLLHDLIRPKMFLMHEIQAIQRYADGVAHFVRTFSQKFYDARVNFMLIPARLTSNVATSYYK